MKLAIDANIIVAALVRNSKARDVIVSGKFELVSPDFVLQEVYKYEDYICSKSGLLKEEFELLVSFVFEHVTIAPGQSYGHKIVEANKLIEDIKDVPYVACYLALECYAIWTSDLDFKGKKGIKTVTTADLLRLSDNAAGESL